MTILTKPKNPPVWGPFDYERYEEQVFIAIKIAKTLN